MKFSRTQEDEVSLNLAPLIDVVFLLLIFFMVTTSFTQENAIDLSLPEASSEQPREQNMTINITVSAMDEISIEGNKFNIESTGTSVDRQVLGEQISLAIKQLTAANIQQTDGDPTIIIQADKAASHGRVILLMDAIARLGIHKIQFAVEPETTNNSN